MKMCKILGVSLLILVSSHSVHSKAPSPSVILNGLNSALGLITRVGELFKTSSEKNEFEPLLTGISNLNHFLRTVLNLILRQYDKGIYLNVLSGYINKIDSCETDYRNYVANPSNATTKNLKKCSDIMESVRALGNYLSGKSITDLPPLFDLYKDSQGVCNGSAMESIFKSLFADFVTGCTVATAVERLENDQHIYVEECIERISIIRVYLKRLYSECAPLSCKAFHGYVQSLIRDNSTISSEYLHEKLSEEYPWFNIIIFKLSNGGKVTESGNFSPGHDFHTDNFALYFFDSNIELASEKENFTLVIEVSKNSPGDYDFGNSTLIKCEGVTIDIFKGFASENNMWCTDTGKGKAVSAGSSNNLSSKCVLIFSLCFVFLKVATIIWPFML